MAALPQHIKATIGEVKHRWRSAIGDVCVLEARDKMGACVSLKGREREACGIRRGLAVDLWGEWSGYRDKRTGKNSRQFAFIGYLASFRSLDGEVNEIMKILIGRGFPRSLAIDLVDAGIFVEQLKRNPYLLLKFPGCGFARTDELYCLLGLNRARKKRQLLCVVHGMLNHDSGSTWFTSQQASAILEKSLRGESDLEGAIRLGVRAGLIDSQRVDGDSRPYWDGERIIAEHESAQREIEIGQWIGERLQSPSRARWPAVSKGELSDHQFTQLQVACDNRSFGILTGGGGTGKTFTIASLLKSVLSHSDASKVVLCAPTGKAAVRISESVAEHGVQLTARTIHSVLGFSGKQWEMPSLALEGVRYVICDESSMVDLELMWRLLKCSRDCALLLVGDPYQLSPVGAGAPFRDMVKAIQDGHGQLTEIRRNAGAIASAGKSIRETGGFSIDDHLELPLGNLSMAHCERTRDCLLEIESHIAAAGERGFDPTWDVQVLTQVNQRSDLSTAELNLRLAPILNPSRAAGSMFSIGDKVMNTKNSWSVELLTDAGRTSPDAIRSRDGEIYVANGEIGRVVRVAEKWLGVHVFSPDRFVMAPRWAVDANESDSGDSGSKFVLAYAITVHKSQGSQWPVIIFVVDSYAGARRLMDRSMIYTGLTRASKYCVIVGAKNTLCAGLRRTLIWDRRTMLAHILQSLASNSGSESLQ